MEYVKNFKESHGNDTVLLLILAFLAGILIGVLLSPAKNGMKNTIAIGSYNGSENEFVNSNNVGDKKKKSKKE